MMTTKEFDAIPDQAKLAQWHTIVKDLEKLKELEQHARLVCFDLYFPTLRNQVDDTGVKNLDIAPGYVLKATPSVNLTLEKDAEKINTALARILKIGSDNQELTMEKLKRIIPYKPSFSLAEFRKLKPSQGKVEAAIIKELQPLITLKPGTPSLKIEGPE